MICSSQINHVNHPDVFPKAAKEQQKKYGVVGMMKNVFAENILSLALFPVIKVLFPIQPIIEIVMEVNLKNTEMNYGMISLAM